MVVLCFLFINFTGFYQGASLGHLIFLGFFLFFFIFIFGFLGFFLHIKTFLQYLFFIELLKLTLCFFFLILFIIFKDVLLLVFILLLLAVAATESAIGLALLINYHNIQFYSDLTVERLKFLRK